MRNSIRGVLTALVAVASIISTSASAGADVTGDSTITTIAGTGAGAFSGDGGPATVAQINQPRDTEYGPDGTLYIVDTYNHRVRAIAPDGTISTVAGNGSTTYNGDGIRATRASLYWPHDLFFDDASGVLYIADSQHHRIRSVTPDGIIHTVAGTGVIGSTGDGGQATQARLKNPKTVFVFGGWLYTAGLDNKVRRVNLATGIIETYAGTGVAGFANGSCAKAQFSSPQRLQVDSVGNVYVADTLNHRIRRIDALRCRVTTVAGTGVAGLGSASGSATSSALNSPRGIVLDGDTVLFIADSNNHLIRRLDLITGQQEVVAGLGKGYAGDGGPARLARFNQPRGLSISSEGDLIIADTFNSRLRRVASA